MEVKTINKEMRKERTKQEFILASKQIIEQDGIEHVSVRKVGERSGYSYATIYNYFKDINSLLVYVSMDYLEESFHYTKQGDELYSDPLSKINHYITRYINFMINHQSAFKLLFTNDLKDATFLLQEAITPKVSTLLYNTIQLIDEKTLHLQKSTILQLLTASIHSKLTMYITHKAEYTKQELIQNIKKEIKEVMNQ